jgi:hypothetical protein
MDEKQAAEFLAISPRTLQAWRVTGGGPAFKKIGRAVRYDSTDLAAFINNRTHSSTAHFSTAGTGK